jgi:hypothetical protein
MVCVLHAPSLAVAFPTTISIWVFFFVFDSLLCVRLSWSLFFSTDCFVTDSIVHSGFYVNAEIPFCWLGLFVATVGMI